VPGVKARIAIVGGGVMGTSIAWHAARRADPIGEPVVLLERSSLAAGSSGRSGAILRQFYASRELAGMARDSLRVYAGFESRTGR
jgi:sarcosine oxidase subunit beta